MSEPNKTHHDSIVRQLAERLKQRNCRGIRAYNIGGEYQNPDKILSEDGSGLDFVPDITVSIPSFIIAVEDAASLESSDKAWKAFSANARKTFKEFLIAVPRNCGEQARNRIKELKIRNAKFLWY